MLPKMASPDFTATSGLAYELPVSVTYLTTQRVVVVVAVGEGGINVQGNSHTVAQAHDQTRRFDPLPPHSHARTKT